MLKVEKDHDYLFKVVVVGESSVGKSSIILRYCDNFYTDSFISTIGVDFKFKNLEKNGKVSKFQVK